MDVAEHPLFEGLNVLNNKTDEENIHLSTISYHSGLQGFFSSVLEKETLGLTFSLSICRAKSLWFQFRLGVHTNLTLQRETCLGKMEIVISLSSVSHAHVPW